MTTGNQLTAKELEILKLFENSYALSIGFDRRYRGDLLFAADRIGIPFSVLSVCQAFARSQPLTDRDFFLIKHIADTLKKSPGDATVTTLLANEPYIAEAYSDAIAKYAALTPNYKAPCSLKRLLSLGGEAVRYGSPRSYAATDTALFSGKDSIKKRINCALNGYFFDTNKNVYVRKDLPVRSGKSPSGASVALIYTREEEKLEILENFFTQPSRPLKVIDAFACAPEQVFNRLLSMDMGFDINASTLPDVNLFPYMVPELRAIIKTSLAFFENVLFGDTVVAVIAPEKQIVDICGQAREIGLSTCCPVTLKKGADVTVSLNGHAVAHLGFNMLNAIKNYPGHTAKIEAHDPKALLQTTKTTKIYDDNTSAAYRAKISVTDSPAPFHEAMYATVGLILNAVADGFDLRNGNMKLSISADLSSTEPSDIGAAVAAILGIYRVETELCVVDESPSIEYSDGKSEIEISLISYSPKRKVLPDTIKNIDPLLFSNLDENGIVDFKSIRNFAYGDCYPKIEPIIYEKNDEIPL